MSGLARDLSAVNLGQGFPDSPGPIDVRVKAAEAVLDGYNQYPPMAGLQALREAVATHYDRFHGLKLDWRGEVTITSGATEALAAALFGLIAPGDEVILFEPLYDAYLPLVNRADGVAKFIRLAPPDWRITNEILEQAFSPRTRLVVLNNPLNPTATVFSRTELELLADYCVRHNAIAVCDEVWEHVVFDGRVHVPLISLPGMRERTVKIGSGGKIFALTGWKVGFVCAAPPLTAVIAKAHQFLTFTTPPNLQAAIAYGLGKEEAYFINMRAEFARSRDRLEQGLKTLGYATLPSQGTYFLSVDLRESGITADDETFCRRSVTEAGVAAIPVSAFYANSPQRSVVRLCFAKKDETIDRGLECLAKAKMLFCK